MSSYVVVIPARYGSQRLPGKPLQLLAGKPLIRHVHERALESGAADVVIATDDERVAAACEAFEARCRLTSGTHASGTDRLAEVARAEGWDDTTIIVNLQGDEPLMPAALIEQCAGVLDDDRADIGTLASPFASQEDFDDPNVVKVVTDRQGFALYFSRAAIPYVRDAGSSELARRTALHHHGIYAYRNGVLQAFVAGGPADLERCEQLEQLRALHMGLRIKVATPEQRPGPGIDTPADLARAARILAG